MQKGIDFLKMIFHKLKVCNLIRHKPLKVHKNEFSGEYSLRKKR